MINENNIKQRLHELEFRLNKEQRFSEEKITQIAKKIEKKEIEPPTTLHGHLIEERNELAQKYEELILSFTILEQKTNNIEKENNILIEELDFFKKQNLSLKFDDRKTFLSKTTFKEKENNNIKDEDTNNLEQKFFECQFNEDQGSISLSQSLKLKNKLFNVNKFKNDSNKLLNNSAENLSQVMEKLMWANEENLELKNNLKKLTNDIENVSFRLQTNDQELQNNKDINAELRTHCKNFQLEIYLLKEKGSNHTIHMNNIDKDYNDLNQDKKELYREIKILNEEIKSLRIINMQQQSEIANIKKNNLQTKCDLEKNELEKFQLIEINNTLKIKLSKMEEANHQLLLCKITTDKQARIIDKIAHLPKDSGDENLILQIVDGKIVLPPKKVEDLGSSSQKSYDIPENELQAENKNFLGKFTGKNEKFKKRINDLKTDLMVENKWKPIINRKSNDDNKY